MTETFASQQNDVYVRLTEGNVTKTHQFHDQINIDLDSGNQIVGVEILAARSVDMDGIRHTQGHSPARDEVCDRIKAAIHDSFCGCPFEKDDAQHRITLDTLDAVMAIVDPIVAERERQREKFDDVTTLLWLHAEAVWKLSLPCGSCHPCVNYSDETWRAAGRKPPYVHEWDEIRAVLGALRAHHEGSVTLPEDWEDQVRLTAYAPDRMAALGDLLDAWHTPAVRPHVNETSTGGYLPRQPIPSGDDWRDRDRTPTSATTEPSPDARVWAAGAPQPAGVTHILERGERHWWLDTDANVWHHSALAGPLLTWDELLSRCGWVVEVVQP